MALCSSNALPPMHTHAHPGVREILQSTTILSLEFRCSVLCAKFLHSGQRLAFLNQWTLTRPLNLSFALALQLQSPPSNSVITYSASVEYSSSPTGSNQAQNIQNPGSSSCFRGSGTAMDTYLVRHANFSGLHSNPSALSCTKF